MHPPTTNGDEDDRRRNGEMSLSLWQKCPTVTRAPLDGQFLHTPPPFSFSLSQEAPDPLVNLQNRVGYASQTTPEISLKLKISVSHSCSVMLQFVNNIRRTLGWKEVNVLATCLLPLVLWQCTCVVFQNFTLASTHAARSSVDSGWWVPSCMNGCMHRC